MLASLQLESDPFVESVKPILAPYKLVSREMHPHDTIVRIGSMAIGGGVFKVIAGPCAVETRDQLRNTARAVKEAGASGLRAGAYKPRTSPYGFAGHGPAALDLLREVGDEFGLPVVTEVMDTADPTSSPARGRAPDRRPQHAQFRFAARGRQSGSGGAEARHVGEDRGAAARRRISPAAGNDQVVLVERGIRTFETATRNTLDLNASLHQAETHLPCWSIPRTAPAYRLVAPMSLAAAAARGRAADRGA